MYFQNYERRKMYLGKSLKSLVWKDPSTGNMVNRRKHWFNLKAITFTIFLIMLEKIESERVTLSDMQGLKVFS